MTHIPFSGLETETYSVTSTSTPQDIMRLSMSKAQKDILQIIRKEEDQAMSLLAANPLLSSLFLTYANRAAALDGPPTSSPIDREWSEMKALNSRLQEEVASLRAQLEKETDRAKTAEDWVEAFRAQIASLRDANRDLEEEMSDERTNVRITNLGHAKHKKEAASTIAVLRGAMEKEAPLGPKAEEPSSSDAKSEDKPVPEPTKTTPAPAELVKETEALAPTEPEVPVPETTPEEVKEGEEKKKEKESRPVKPPYRINRRLSARIRDLFKPKPEVDTPRQG